MTTLVSFFTGAAMAGGCAYCGAVLASGVSGLSFACAVIGLCVLVAVLASAVVAAVEAP